MATQSTSLSAGTAPNHAWHSTGLWCFATGFSWNRRTLLPQRSTYAWAVRRLAYEACDTGILSSELAAGIRRVKGAKRLGVRIGNWLTIDQARTLLDHSSAEAVRAKRDQAILAVLVGCGLRRAEVAGRDAGGALGCRRPDRQGKAHAHGSGSGLGEASHRRVDRVGGNQWGDNFPASKPDGQSLGRWHHAESDLAYCERCCATRWYQEPRSLSA